MFQVFLIYFINKLVKFFSTPPYLLSVIKVSRLLVFKQRDSYITVTTFLGRKLRDEIPKDDFSLCLSLTHICPSTPTLQTQSSVTNSFNSKTFK
jgi:hypothetical protein